jgi:hypothetical protein
MSDANDNQADEASSRRASGATRRIVFEESVHEKRVPRAVGRKLESPIDDKAGSQTRRPVAPVKNPQKRKALIMVAGGLATILIVVPATAFVLRMAHNRKQTVKPPAAIAVSSVTPEVKPSATPTPDPSPATASSTVELDDSKVRLMVLQLASQISQKSGYEFAPEFVELILGRTMEYKSEEALLAARQYRREINKAFRDEGVNPLIGYALGMSRSRFDPLMSQKGVGIWQLPVEVARSQGYIGATENPARLKVPETSAQIAASYTKQLLSSFDTEDFMYAIACFGMNLQEAGLLQARLLKAAPDAKSRRDVMKIIRMGVLTGEQVDNIARFFAAGIVGENPQEFGFERSQSFSSLY